MFGHGRAADVCLSAALLRDLVITIADSFVAVLNPKTRGVHDISQLRRIIFEKAGRSHGESSRYHAIMKTQVGADLILGQTLQLWLGRFHRDRSGDSLFLPVFVPRSLIDAGPPLLG